MGPSLFEYSLCLKLDSRVYIKLLKVICNPSDYASAKRTVNNTVIVRMRQEHLMTNRDYIAVRHFHNSRFFLNRTQCNDTNLRLHDDRCAHHVSKLPYVTDGKRSA